MNDVTQATRLVTPDVKGLGVVGDRAYDSNGFLAHLEQLGLDVVIPPRANRVVQRQLARAVYRRRNVIERWFGRLKSFRRIATRYEKTAASYSGFFSLGSLIVGLSGWKA